MSEYKDSEKDTSPTTILIPETTRVTPKYIDEHFPNGDIILLDVPYRIPDSSSISWLPYGFQSGRVLNIDHHTESAPIAVGGKDTSTVHLTARYIELFGLPPPTTTKIITHVDADSFLSLGMLAGWLPVKPEYLAAGKAADHTGERNIFADTLQGMQHARNIQRSLKAIRVVEQYGISALQQHDAEAFQWVMHTIHTRELLDAYIRSKNEHILTIPPPSKYSGFSIYLIDCFHLHDIRETNNQPIDPTYALPMLPDALLVISAGPHQSNQDTITYRVRLGYHTPDMDVRVIMKFLKEFGGRSRAGSTSRKGGSTLPLHEFIDQLLHSLSEE